MNSSTLLTFALVVSPLAGCASTASQPAAPAKPKPAWVGQPSGPSGARNEYLVGIASSQGAPAAGAQQAAYDRAKKALHDQLDQYAQTLLELLKKNPPADPKELQAAVGAHKALFDSMRSRVQVVEEWRGPDGTVHALARLNLTELMLVVGSSRTWSSGTKQGLMGALSQTIEPPPWVKRGSGRFEGAIYGVGAASTEEIRNFSLCWETADNRARAELAGQLKKVGAGNGSVGTTIRGAQVVDHWLDKSGVLFALVKLQE